MRKPIRYLAIGDSLTAGFGAPDGLGFADRYRESAEQTLGVTVSLDNAGVNGATSVDMLAALSADGGLRKRVRRAHIITLTVGGNDLLQGAKRFYADQDTRYLMHALKTCHENLGRMVKIIRLQKRGLRSRRYMIRLANLYNPIPFVVESVDWVQRFNRMYLRCEAQDLKVADVYRAFIGREQQLLSDDLIHPNARGYALMAERMHALGYAPLQ